MPTILIIFLVFSFSSVRAQEVEWLTKSQTKKFIEMAARDPNVEVLKDQDGGVQIKKRTPKSKDKPDPAENQKNSNWQFMFGIGFFVGFNYVGAETAAQGKQNSSDFDSTALQFGGEISIRPPYIPLKRFNFGANYSLGNGLMGPIPDYAPANGTEFQGKKDGLAPQDMGAVTYKSIFAEYDILIFPSKSERFAFSVGYHYGSANTDWGTDSSNFHLYNDQGFQFKLRTIDGGPGGLGPYMLIKLSNKRASSVVFGIKLDRGRRVNVKTKPEK